MWKNSELKFYILTRGRWSQSVISSIFSAAAMFSRWLLFKSSKSKSIKIWKIDFVGNLENFQILTFFITKSIRWIQKACLNLYILWEYCWNDVFNKYLYHLENLWVKSVKFVFDTFKSKNLIESEIRAAICRNKSVVLTRKKI